MKSLPTLLSASLLASIGLSSAQATVTNITTVNVGNKTNMVSTTLSDGRTLFSNNGLIGVDLFHFRGTSNSSTLMSPDSAATVNLSSTKSDLLEDAALNTGAINPGRAGASNVGITVGLSPTATTNGIGLNFLTPVYNGLGEDLIVIEFASDSGQAGDAFVISGLVGGTGFASVSSGFTTVSTYEFSALMSATTSLNQTLPVNNLSDLDTKSGVLASSFSAPFYRAVAIDLSDLGVAPGAFATGIFIQATNTGSEIDTVFIAGFAIPEPMTGLLGLLALGALAKCGRRSRVA